VLGASLLPGSVAGFGKLRVDETEKWGKVVKFAGAKLDWSEVTFLRIVISLKLILGA